MSNLKIIKLGGSVITYKNSPTPRLRINHLQQLASSLAKAPSRLIIILGAGSFGHPYAKKYQLKNGLPSLPNSNLPSTHNHWYGALKTHLSVTNLLVKTTSIFLEAGLPAFPLSTAQFTNCPSEGLKLIKALLEENLIPVLHGDAIFTSTNPNSKISIVSGDDLLVDLSNHFHPSQIDIATHGDGIFLNNSHIPNITREDLLSRLHCLSRKTTTHDVTGGFFSKIEKIASKTSSIPVHIYDATNPTHFAEALIKNLHGTNLI